jgi:hypothetical protein
MHETLMNLGVFLTDKCVIDVIAHEKGRILPQTEDEKGAMKRVIAMQFVLSSNNRFTIIDVNYITTC